MILATVLAVAAVVGLVLVGLELRPAARPLDTEREERWLVAHAPARLRPVLHHVDRRVAGGVMVGAAFVVLLVAGALVGWLLDSIDEGRGFARWDRSAAAYGARHATPETTTVLKAITQFGATPVLVVVALAVGALAWRTRGGGPLLYLAVVLIGVVALNNGFKLLVDRERPDVRRLVQASGSSFPSGHSAAAAACWAAIALVALRRASRRGRAIGAAAAGVIAVAVATSRVLLGVHWLTDVMAGLLVGWGWFALATLAFGGRLLRLGAPVRRV